MKIKIFANPQKACIAVIEKILALQQSQSKVTIALSGGNTPKLLFSLIASNYPKAIASNVHFFWGDERMVSYDSSESNYGVFYRELVESGVISAENVHPIPYNSNYLVAKEEIERVIRKEVETIDVAFSNGCSNRESSNRESGNSVCGKNESCSIDGVLETFPQFSLVILGVGEDGHVASIFPNNLESFSSKEITEIVQHPVSGQTRITLTGSTINAAKEIVMLCTGKSKRKIITDVIKKGNLALPATHVVGGNDGDSGVVGGTRVVKGTSVAEDTSVVGSTRIVGYSGEVDGYSDGVEWYSDRVEWYLDCGSSPQ